tara:strand:+ start:140 stop:334 length:195 start_codon:yes stop_codon:yes gene_type:complete
MNFFYSILILLISVIGFAAISAAFISVYERFFGTEPNRLILVLVNLLILAVAYFFIISPVLEKL